MDRIVGGRLLVEESLILIVRVNARDDAQMAHVPPHRSPENNLLTSDASLMLLVILPINLR